jgi:hypothetical protein
MKDWRIGSILIMQSIVAVSMSSSIQIKWLHYGLGHWRFVVVWTLVEQQIFSATPANFDQNFVYASQLLYWSVNDTSQ